MGLSIKTFRFFSNNFKKFPWVQMISVRHSLYTFYSYFYSDYHISSIWKCINIQSIWTLYYNILAHFLTFKFSTTLFIISDINVCSMALAWDGVKYNSDKSTVNREIGQII